MDEPDWDQVRRRARRRAAAMMALIVGPVVLVGAAVGIFRPHDYPAGDIRNEPIFWILVGLFFVVVIGAMIVGSIRELRR